MGFDLNESKEFVGYGVYDTDNSTFLSPRNQDSEVFPSIGEAMEYVAEKVFDKGDIEPSAVEGLRLTKVKITEEPDLQLGKLITDLESSLEDGEISQSGVSEKVSEFIETEVKS